jgi:hypothetical protein
VRFWTEHFPPSSGQGQPGVKRVERATQSVDSSGTAQVSRRPTGNAFIGCTDAADERQVGDSLTAMTPDEVARIVGYRDDPAFVALLREADVEF